VVSSLVKTYGIDLDSAPDLLAQLKEAALPAESDKLAWIRSHALRKTTATALDDAGQTARQIADQLGQAKVSITQDTYLARRPVNPAAAQALEHAFDDPDSSPELDCPSNGVSSPTRPLWWLAGRVRR
jgi:integrase